MSIKTNRGRPVKNMASHVGLKDETIIVTLSAPKGGGKTTLAEHAVLKWQATEVVHFALRLKQICTQYFMLLDAQVFGDKKEEDFLYPKKCTERICKDIIRDMYRDLVTLGADQNSFNPHAVAINMLPYHRAFKNTRELLQVVGTDIMHKVYQPYSAIVTTFPLYGRKGVFLADDCRYPIEVEYAKKVTPFVYPVRIVGRNESNGAEHVSESAWKDIKFFAEIDNSGDMDSFLKNAQLVFTKIKNDVVDRVAKGESSFSLDSSKKVAPVQGKGILSPEGAQERVPVRW